MEIFRVIICGNNFMDAEMDDYPHFKKIASYLDKWGILSLYWSVMQQFFILENFLFKITKVVNYKRFYVFELTGSVTWKINANKLFFKLANIYQ